MLTSSRFASWIVVTQGQQWMELRNLLQLKLTHCNEKVRNPQLRKKSGIKLKEMGPEAGIEFASCLELRQNPAARDPQSPRLPLPHSGHDFPQRGLQQVFHGFDLLAYPWVKAESNYHRSNYGLNFHSSLDSILIRINPNMVM